jgi:hypothetical protein
MSEENVEVVRAYFRLATRRGVKAFSISSLRT